MRKVNLNIDIITQFRKSGTSIGANVNEGGSEFKSEKFEKCKDEVKPIKNVLSTIII